MVSGDDQRALEDLHNRYVHAVDRGDFAMVRSLYTDDAVEVHGDYAGPVDGFIDLLRAGSAYFLATTHVVANLLCHVTGDAAESEARGTAYLRMAGDPPYGMIVVNRLFDRYRRVDGHWLFSRRNVLVDWAETFPARAGALDVVAPYPAGEMGGGDPVYREAPDLIAALRRGLPPIA